VKDITVYRSNYVIYRANYFSILSFWTETASGLFSYTGL